MLKLNPCGEKYLTLTLINYLGHYTETEIMIGYTDYIIK